jgi:hypothetical protein
MTAELAAKRELTLQVDRRQLAIRLVGRIDPASKGGLAAQALIEGDCDVLGPHILQEIRQKSRETVESMGRVAVRIHHVGRHGVIGAENEIARIDMVNDARAHLRSRRSGTRGSRARIAARDCAVDHDSIECHSIECHTVG